MTTCVDFDFHRLLFPAATKSTATHQTSTRDATTTKDNSNKVTDNNTIPTVAGSMSSVTSRVPLLPRNPNHGSGATATTSHSSSGEEGLSNSSKEGGSSTRSSSTAAVLNRLSVVESSNNENNKRILPSLASSMKNIFAQQQLQDSGSNNNHNLPETSTITHTGAANSRDVVGPGNSNNLKVPHAVAASRKAARGRSVERQTERQGVSSSSRSTSAPRSDVSTTAPKRVPAASSSSGSGREDNNNDGESVIFEEKRPRLDGDGYTIHQYLRGRLLGKGGFAKVYFCTALDTNKNYAVKVVPKANLVKARARQKLQAEIKIHRTLKHKHICEYKHFFEDRENCYILLELCHNQSLNELLKRRKRLTEPEARYFLAQLLQAVAYMHDQCVIHRDLKLGNLFLDRHLQIKVGDLGLATRLSHADEKRKTICGTPNYIAPEVIQGTKETRGHSFEVDVWSMGVILYTFLVGKPPYEAKDVKSTYQRIIANEYSFPDNIPMSEAVQDLIASMLQTNPADRPLLPEIASHPFLTAFKIPFCLPANSTHVAPDWRENEHGELIPMERHDQQVAHAAIGKKLDAALSSSRQNRRPFMSRDPNTDKARNTANEDRIGPKKADEDCTDSAVPERGMAVAGGSAAKARTQPTDRVITHVATQQRFAIHDDFEHTSSTEVVIDYANNRKSSLSRAPLTVIHDEADEIASRTAALSLRQMSPPTTTCSEPPSAAVSAGVSTYYPDEASTTATPQGATATLVFNHKQELDMLILKQMHDRLTAVLEVTDNRKYAYGQQTSPSTNSALRPVSKGGPNKWVVRYVDYTSKYGLGFLLSDGSSGVYFNDSTKAVIEAEGDVFQYVERQKATSDPLINNGPRRNEPTMATHTLSTHPKSLQKKVTLLKHFRNYLVEQQKQDNDLEAGGTFLGSPSASDSSQGNVFSDLVYVKKWIRTKHAILFRLSDQTVQIVFYDQTEVLMTPDERFVTFVDKTRARCTYYLSDELVGCNDGLGKRLKYCREVLQQLLVSPR